MKTDPIVSLKKVIRVIQELCQELYNNHFSMLKKAKHRVVNRYFNHLSIKAL
jgi:hypothetical protein